jgi:multidrug efflux pump subunit AcrB
LPGGVRLDILYDRSKSIRESLHDVQFTLVLAIALVVLVIFLFLRNVRATLIPSAAIPLSIIGTFGVMYLLDFSVNNFSLMALILAVGFVVDDAIVVLENIVRHIEKGESPMDAALKGGREIGFTILSMTLSLAAVFIPVLFMGGILGRLLNEFAVTIAVAILISGFISLSLTPMLCSRFLKGAHYSSHSALFRWSESVFDNLLAGYRKTLEFALRHHVAVSLAALVMALVTVWMFLKAPKGFPPNEDTGRIAISTEAEQGIAFDKMIELQQRAADIVERNPAVEAFMSRIGGGSSASSGNAGRLFLTLKPRSERPPIDDIIRQLRKDLAGIPGLKVFAQNPPAIRIGGTLTKSLYQFTLVGPDLDVLYDAAGKIMMIDFALDAQRSDRKPPATAIFEACIVRFRPIMMTTLAAMMGTLPIALGLGAGGDVRRPLGLAVVGGLVISQVVTLYITPIIYLYLEALQRRLGRKSASSGRPGDSPAPSPPLLASVD